MDAPKEESTVYALTTARLEALSDGVLAFAITLLVLGFGSRKEGIVAAASEGEVLNKLLAAWPDLFGFVLSFLVVATYWLLHHIMFHYIHRSDRGLLWLNILFLMGVSFIPFPTDVLADSFGHLTQEIVIFYGMAQFITSLFLVLLWLHATWRRRLVPSHIDPWVVRAVTRAALAGPLLYLLGMAASFLSLPLALVIYISIPVFYVLPSRIDHHWRSLGHRPS